MDEIRLEDILEILREIRPDLDFAREENLMGDKLLTSFDVLAIVSEISESFGIRISAAEIKPENFNSVDAMVELITRMQE